MTLPQLDLPKLDLPFDIPVLLHPPIDHFAIALPVVILLLEFYNLFAKRKSIGGFSFLLMILTVGIFVAAYLSGSVDGKDAYSLLSSAGQSELKAHKLLGTYLMLSSAALLFFKFLAMTGKFYFKFLFFLILIGFIAITFKQAKDGGELVYEYGSNVEKVKDINDELSDIKEELEEANEALEESKVDTSSKINSVTNTVTSSIQKPAITPINEVKKKTESIITNSTLLQETIVETSPEKEKKELEESNKKVIEKLIDTAKDKDHKILEVVDINEVKI